MLLLPKGEVQCRVIGISRGIEQVSTDFGRRFFFSIVISEPQACFYIVMYLMFYLNKVRTGSSNWSVAPG
jgi:hypothetical protein